MTAQDVDRARLVMVARLGLEHLPADHVHRAEIERIVADLDSGYRNIFRARWETKSVPTGLL